MYIDEVLKHLYAPTIPYCVTANIFIQKQQGRQSLILSRSWDMLVYSQMSQETSDIFKSDCYIA